MSLRVRGFDAEADRTAGGLEKIPDVRELEFTRRRVLARAAHEGGDFRGGDANSNGIHGSEPDDASRVENEDSRFGDAALFLGVVDVPVLNDTARGVAQNGEWQMQCAADSLRFLRRIHGDGDHIRADGTEFVVVINILRQLAKTEGSPMASIEKEDQRAAGGQFG